MDLGHADGKLDVQYDGRLVKLIREVRQLLGIGYNVPMKIQNVAETGSKFYRQAVVLKQVFDFTSFWSVPYLAWFKINCFMKVICILANNNSKIQTY